MKEGGEPLRDAKMWADQYGLIGEFVVKFEWISLHLRIGMQFMIEGIEKRGNSKVMALLADDSAQSLLNSYRSVVLTSDHINLFGIKVINKFHSQVSKLIEQRNEIIHGMLAIGWPSGSIQPGDQILGYKLKNRKEGATAKQISISPAEFRALIERCEKATSLMLRIFKCYSQGGLGRRFCCYGQFIRFEEPSQMIRGKKHLSLCLIFLAVSTVTLSGCARATITGTDYLAVVTSAPIPVQSGYDSNEQFCGTLGKVQYVAIKHQVHFNLNLAAMKANRQYRIDWQNNYVRGYTVGVFSTDHSGAIRSGSLRMFRAGEVRGIGLMVYYLDGYTPLGMQHFKPC